MEEQKLYGSAAAKFADGHIVTLSADTPIQVYIRNGLQAGLFSQEKVYTDFYEKYGHQLFVIVQGYNSILASGGILGSSIEEKDGSPNMILLPLMKDNIALDFNGPILKIRYDATGIKPQETPEALFRYIRWYSGMADSLREIQAESLAARNVTLNALEREKQRFSLSAVRGGLPNDIAKSMVLLMGFEATLYEAARPIVARALPPRALQYSPTKPRYKPPFVG